MKIRSNRDRILGMWVQLLVSYLDVLRRPIATAVFRGSPREITRFILKGTGFRIVNSSFREIGNVL